MNETETEERLNKLLELATNVRYLQREYFRTRNPQVLNQAKAAERELDRYLDYLRIPTRKEEQSRIDLKDVWG